MHYMLTNGRKDAVGFSWLVVHVKTKLFFYPTYMPLLSTTLIHFKVQLILWGKFSKYLGHSDHKLNLSWIFRDWAEEALCFHVLFFLGRRGQGIHVRGWQGPRRQRSESERVRRTNAPCRTQRRGLYRPLHRGRLGTEKVAMRSHAHCPWSNNTFSWLNNPDMSETYISLCLIPSSNYIGR